MKAAVMKLIDIKPNPDNPRVLKDEKFKKLVQSLKDFPVMTELREVVLDEDSMVIGGNQRYVSAKEAGWKEIATKTFTKEDAERNNKLTGQDKTYEEYRAEFIIKDNVSFGEMDWDMIANNWTDYPLPDWGLDLPAKFWIEDVEEDDAPEVTQEEPKSQLGEIYKLGKHRVMCGDSTKIDDVEKLTGGALADMVFTDPPYNVDYEGGTGLKIENDKQADGDFLQFLTDAFTAISMVTKSGGAIYVCHADSEGYNFRKAFKDSGYLLKQCIIWNKSALVMGRQDYQWKHEPILYGWKEGASHNFYGGRSQTTVWDIDKPQKNGDHPTMKPITLIAKAVQNSSKSQDIVLDTFLGSGSTLIACEQVDRVCYGMELDPRYTDVIRKRWAKYVYPDTWEQDWETMTPELK